MKTTLRPAPRKPWFLPFALLAVGLALLAGCAGLDEVRRYAGESTIQLAAYPALTGHFRDTYAREAPYLPDAALAAAADNDRRRQAAYADLIGIHTAVTRYLATLGTLAGDKSFDVSGGVASLAGGIKTHSDFGLDAGQVDAVAEISRIVARWATAGVQDQAVRAMVKEGNAPLQTSLDGMAQLLRLYRKTHENERRTVLGLFDTEFALARVQPKDPLLIALAKRHYGEQVAGYAALDQQFDAAEKAVALVGAGHASLYRNVDRLSATELKDELGAIVNDLRQVSRQVQALR